MAKRGRPKKDKYDQLDDEFKSKVNSSSREDIKAIVSKVALDQAELMQAKKQDQPLEEARMAYADASEVYRSGSKMNRLKIMFCKEVLDSSGG